MTEDPQAVITRLRARVAEAERARAGAEYARQQAEKTVSDASAALQHEFGVETPEQAKALRDSLDSQIAAEAQAIERALGGA